MLDTINSLFEDHIKDLYSAENQLTKALPRMAKKASNESLKAAFESHLEETREHVERLARIAEMLDIKPSGKVCKGMQGLLEEGKEVLEEEGEDAVIDAALIAAAQKCEHYEISAYGTARAVAEQIGNDRIAKLLQKTLDEESAADETLTKISESEVMGAALSAGEEDSDKDEAEATKRPRASARSGARMK